jgi:drug/metabolite transporter (DMT)-like permease
VRPRDALLLLILSGIWGSAYLFIHVVVDEVGAFTVVAGRLTIAALFLAPLAARQGGALPPRGGRWPVLFLAVFYNVIPFSLITIAEKSIATGLAATLVATMPLFTLMVAVGAGTERPTLEAVAGLLVGFVGAVVVVGPDLGDITSSNAAGDLIVVLAAASYGLSTVVARQTARGSAMSMASGQTIFGAMIALPLALAVDGVPAHGISIEATLSWLGLGVLCSGVAFVLFYLILESASATQASLVSYIIPIFAALLGWAVLGESIGVNLVVGLALIVIGVAGVNGGARPLRDLARRVGGPAPAGAARR